MRTPCRSGVPLFAGGEIVLSPKAQSLYSDDPKPFLKILNSHLWGDWGELDVAGKRANESALECGGKLVSMWHIGPAAVWVITDAEREHTRFLVPAEYERVMAAGAGA